ncbi:MAG TPA: RNA polymerase sigma factor [Candidatus Acidoferrum sp.]|jgi:RNA polymerase sigma-70 factor (ECF subfamily)|nr:RNA polymerase sigma factor [Candidatus Acidoferrum sp.]
MQRDGRMELSDEELYRRMRTGDRMAFAELYDRRGTPLHRYVQHISGSHSAAEEVTHEVFLRLIKQDSSFDDRRGSLEAYLYGIARNLVRVMRRHQMVEASAEPVAEDNILGDLIRNERTAALHAALRELPDVYRDAVILCDLEERSYEDAARLMACPVGTVRSRLHRARLLLAARLKPLAMSGVTAR